MSYFHWHSYLGFKRQNISDLWQLLSQLIRTVAEEEKELKNVKSSSLNRPLFLS